MTVLVFLFGLVAGVVLLWLLLDWVGRSYEGQRHLAERQAHDRLRDLRIEALHGMADVMACGGVAPAAGRWPSEVRASGLGFTDHDVEIATRPDIEVLDGEVVDEERS